MGKQRAISAAKSGKLTRREQEFCQRLREGKDYAEIAREMGVARHLPKQYAWQVRAKLGAQNQGRLIVWLVEAECGQE